MADINLEEIPDEFKIHNWDELIIKCNGDAGEGKTFYLVNDIDLYAEYTSKNINIPRISDARNFVVEGMGHIIYNLPIDGNAYFSLTGRGYSPTFNNLIFRNIYPTKNANMDSSVFNISGGAYGQPTRFILTKCSFYGDIGCAKLFNGNNYGDNLLKSCVIKCYATIQTASYNYLTNCEYSACENSYYELIVKNNNTTKLVIHSSFTLTNSTFIIRDLMSKTYDFTFNHGELKNSVIYWYGSGHDSNNIFNVQIASTSDGPSIFVNGDSPYIDFDESATFINIYGANSPEEAVDPVWLESKGFVIAEE